MNKLNLTQYEKNCLYYALQYRIAKQLKEASLAIYDRTEETVLYELDDAKEKLKLLYKLEKKGWSSIDGE